MKRGAEKQMTKAGREDFEEDEEPQKGFAKADDAVLATRKIRALPRRSQPSTALTTSITNGAEVTTTTTPRFSGSAGFGSPDVAPAPTFVTNGADTTASTTSRFAGFAGFGNAPAGPTPFSFVPPSKSFSLPPTTPMSPPTSVFGNPSPPSIASSASSTAKSLASFLTPPASASASPAPSPARPVQKEKPVDENLDATVNYYCSLRGLNHSFLSAITSALDKDPFNNLSQVFDNYNSTWQNIQKDFDEHNAKPKTRTEDTSDALAPGFAWTSTKPAASEPPPPKVIPKPPSSFAGFSESKPSLDMPKPPIAFTGFPPVVAVSGGPKPPGFVPLIPEKEKEKTTTTPSSGGFTFPASSSAASTSSPFTLGGSASSASPNPFALPDTTKSAPTPASVFGSKAASTTTLGTKSAFGGGSFGSSTSNPFSVQDSSKPTASYIGPSSFTFKPSTSDSGAGNPKAELSNPFGAPSGSFGGSGKFGNSDTKTTGFTFGSGGSTPGSGPASTGTGSFFGFGTGSGSSGSIGNPVGFGFGTPATPKPLEAEGSGSGTLTEEENSQGSLGSEEDPAKFMMATNPHDEEGEGEEDEETLHYVRTKVFKLHKSTGTTKWITAGLGILRLKTHKDTGARRLLLRNSSTGKININFNLYSGMTPTLDKVFVSFIGHEADGSSITYKAKLKSEQDAAELRDAIEREVQSLKE